MRTVITLEIEHKGEIAHLADKAAGRVYTLQGVSNCTPIEPEVVVLLKPQQGLVLAVEDSGMNFTQKVLSVMEDGKTYTSAELRELTGADARLIGHALRNIKKWGYVEIVPPRQQAYSINDTGRSRIVELPPEVRSKKERERLKTAKRRARLRAEAAAPVKPQPPKVDLVSTAMQSRPALDMAWMSVARTQEGAHA